MCLNFRGGGVTICLSLFLNCGKCRHFSGEASNCFGWVEVCKSIRLVARLGSPMIHFQWFLTKLPAASKSDYRRSDYLAGLAGCQHGKLSGFTIDLMCFLSQESPC